MKSSCELFASRDREMTLNELDKGELAHVKNVLPLGSERGALDTKDAIAMRLEALGFVEGEPVRVMGYGPFGRDPLLVRIGNTRFALRHQEAERVIVTLQPRP